MSLVRPCSTSAIVCPLPVLTQLAWYAERIWSALYPHTKVGNEVTPNCCGRPVAICCP